MSKLIIKNLTKRFADVEVIRNLSFSVNSGEIVAIKGAAAAGKTTLLKIIAGLLAPTSGTVKLSGNLILPGEEENHYRLGLMTREQGIYYRLTTRQYLKFFGQMYGVSGSRVEEVIRMTGLLDRQGEVMTGFSENLIARVLLARAIIHQPELLLLDEPTAHLDLETMEILRKVILELAEQGIIILLTTSSQEEAQSLGRRIGKMRRGMIESWTDVKELKDEKNKDGAMGSGKVLGHLRVEKIPAKVEGKIILFDPQELVYVEVIDGSSVLHGGGEEYQCPLTLTELEERLKPFGFFRSHRSYLVNLQRVREVIPWTRNSYSLVLDDAGDTTIPLSKNNFKELEEMLGV